MKKSEFCRPLIINKKIMIKMIFYFTNEIQIFLHNILNAHNNNKIITHMILHIFYYL